jgi:hypothetical protein
MPKPRRGRPGPSPICVTDPAFVDKVFWTRMRIEGTGGAQVITRTKKNMKPIEYGERRVDRKSPVNEGVIPDVLVGFDGAGNRGGTWHRD